LTLRATAWDYFVLREGDFAMSSQILANTVVRILRQPGIWKIGFDLAGLCVTGQRYAMVAKAVAEGKIACEVVSKFKPQVGGNAPGMVTLARYDADLNAMLFEREDFAANKVHEERVIVHEATHAIFDLFAKSADDRTLSINDESAAVLAEALYIRLCDKPAGAFAMFIDGPQDEALKLADKMMAETGDFERDKRTYFLRAQQTQKLRDAVAKDWNFVRTVEPGGIISDRTGSQYIYNGVVRCYSCWVHGTPPR
jgi:hypothetical protein